MGQKMNMAELFRHWLVQQVDSENAVWNEVIDPADGGQLGEFCVDDAVGATENGRTQLDILFVDKTKMQVTMERMDGNVQKQPKRKP